MHTRCVGRERKKKRRCTLSLKVYAREFAKGSKKENIVSDDGMREPNRKAETGGVAGMHDESYHTYPRRSYPETSS